MGSQKVRTGRIVRYQNHPQLRAVADNCLENLTLSHLIVEYVEWQNCDTCDASCNNKCDVSCFFFIVHCHCQPHQMASVSSIPLDPPTFTTIALENPSQQKSAKVSMTKQRAKTIAANTNGKQRASWSIADETDLILFLFEHRAEADDGFNFKTATFNTASFEVDAKRTTGAPKTGKVCKNKWVQVHIQSSLLLLF